ncbi:MAG: heme d1 biosynthesis radical SAM protein NirJ1 [Candidatus Omnitrophica bacterium CG11_big_fil_rev_8_21_14_0_20_41_12]|nr:MAG: heme d1 biosynthesis radical SAM protein NirJ1 [Candidatus Omnitrophica bacterium CG11_big_fil_rev_8_21_14_0_20_41_12]
MINCTRLLCDKPGFYDEIRYQKGKPADTNRPIVVWNSTRRCNLKCIHCYIDAKNTQDTGELTTQEAKILIDDLASFGAPVFLFSGGEPLMREDLFELGKYAKDKGLRTVISTNGTLITNALAKKIKDAGFSYVGVSLDGLEAINDKFREQKGAFKKALSGIRSCLKNDVRVGLRFTINKHNFRDLPGIFDLIKTEHIPRACFYHLVYSGRGSALINDDLTHPEARDTMDLIFACSQELSGMNTEILTVDNHADGVYLYLQLKKVDPKKAQRVLELLKINGGNKSGVGIADVDNLGNVHPDQFWREHTFGNVKEKKFSQIWTDESNVLLKNLRNRIPLLKGKCGRCNFKDICAGNFRSRAETLYGDIWQEDPACYLTEDEILDK